MIEKLRGIPFFKAFPEEALQQLTTYLTVETFVPDHVIFNEGDEGDCMYFVQHGEVEIRKSGKTLTVFRDGHVFGEMALFERTGRSADAVTLVETSVYRLGNDDFRKFLLEHPKAGSEFLYDGIQEMSRRLRSTSEYLITIFETGKVVGGDYELKEMAERIVTRLLRDMKDATGAMILLLNPFHDVYEVACARNMTLLDLDAAIEAAKHEQGERIALNSDQGAALGVPLMDDAKLLGYIFLEKARPGTFFTTEQEIIVAAVGNQVGLGIFKAYSKQEEEDRRRLEQSRTWRY